MAEGQRALGERRPPPLPLRDSTLGGCRTRTCSTGESPKMEPVPEMVVPVTEIPPALSFSLSPITGSKAGGSSASLLPKQQPICARALPAGREGAWRSHGALSVGVSRGERAAAVCGRTPPPLVTIVAGFTVAT